MKQRTILIAFAFLTGSTIKAQSNNQKESKMKVAVWDTYVTKNDSSVMHFDIIAPEEIKHTTIIYGYGKA